MSKAACVITRTCFFLSIRKENFSLMFLATKVNEKGVFIAIFSMPGLKHWLFIEGRRARSLCHEITRIVRLCKFFYHDFGRFINIKSCHTNELGSREDV